MDHSLETDSANELILDRAILQAKNLADEVIAVNKLLIDEIERDRRLMSGIQKRDREIEELKAELKALKKDLGGPKSRKARSMRALRLGRLLPKSLRGTDVPAPLLRLKRMYWASK